MQEYPVARCRFMKKHVYYIGILLFTLIIISCKRNKRSEEFAKLNYRLEGCFASNSAQLKLYKSNDSVNAILWENGEFILNIRLSSRQLASFDSFVKKLRDLKKVGGCTNIEYYTLYINGETIKKVDASCEWDGYAEVKGILLNTK